MRRRVAALPWTRQAAPKQPYSEVAPVPPECRVPVLVSPFRRHSLADKQMDTLGIEPRASRMLSGCDTTTPCAPLLLEVVAVQRRMSSRQGTTSHPQRFTAKLPRQRFCAAPSFVAQVLLTSMICPVAESHTFLSFGQLQCGWGACPCGVHVAEADDVHAWQQGLCVASWCNG